MPINVTPVSGLSEHSNDVRLCTARIVNDLIVTGESLRCSGTNESGDFDG